MNFKNLKRISKISKFFEKCNILEMRKKSTIAKFQLFGVFQVGLTSLLPSQRQFYKNYSQNHF